MSHELMGLAARYGRSWTPVRPDRDKVQRAQQWSALAEQGRVYLLRLPGANVDDFLAEAHMFPDGAHDDMIDAVSGAFELWRRYSAASAPIVGTY
jgi:predicted phage terminase large subunit-like protein